MQMSLRGCDSRSVAVAPWRHNPYVKDTYETQFTNHSIYFPRTRLANCWHGQRPGAQFPTAKIPSMRRFYSWVFTFKDHVGGPEADLNDTVNTSLHSSSIHSRLFGLFRFFSWPEACFTGGHSLGELSALTALWSFILRGWASSRPQRGG